MVGRKPIAPGPCLAQPLSSTRPLRPFPAHNGASCIGAETARGSRHVERRVRRIVWRGSTKWKIRVPDAEARTEPSSNRAHGLLPELGEYGDRRHADLNLPKHWKAKTTFARSRSCPTRCGSNLYGFDASVASPFTDQSGPPRQQSPPLLRETGKYDLTCRTYGIICARLP